MNIKFKRNSLLGQKITHLVNQTCVRCGIFCKYFSLTSTFSKRLRLRERAVQVVYLLQLTGGFSNIWSLGFSRKVYRTMRYLDCCYAFQEYASRIARTMLSSFLRDQMKDAIATGDSHTISGVMRRECGAKEAEAQRVF